MTSFVTYIAWKQLDCRFNIDFFLIFAIVVAHVLFIHMSMQFIHMSQFKYNDVDTGDIRVIHKCCGRGLLFSFLLQAVFKQKIWRTMQLNDVRCDIQVGKSQIIVFVLIFFLILRLLLHIYFTDRWGLSKRFIVPVTFYHLVFKLRNEGPAIDFIVILIVMGYSYLAL